MITSFFFAFFSLATAATTAVETSYLSFTPPTGWDCFQEDVDWICSPQESSAQRQTILILSAKQAGPEENYDFLQRRLSQPMSLSGRPGSPQRSTPLSVDVLEIDGISWVDATHLNSEVENFKTRYIATTQNNLSVLMSFTAHQDLWPQFHPLYEQVLASIQLAPQEVWAQLGQNSNLHSNLGAIYQNENQTSFSELSLVIWLLIGGIVAMVGTTVWFILN